MGMFQQIKIRFSVSVFMVIFFLNKDIYESLRPSPI